MPISYKYMEKFLSKNNSDLIYILSFKTLEETIVVLDELTKEINVIINKNSEFKNNSEFQNRFDEYNSNIKNNISEYNTEHEKIFGELVEWQKYLNLNLHLPSSSNKSIFKNTAYVGDSIPSNKKMVKINENVLQEFKDDEHGGSFNSQDINILKDYKVDLSEFFLPEEKDRLSYILSDENKFNLRILYVLTFFYSYSYCIIMSFLDERIGFKYKKPKNIGEGKITHYIYLFGLIITFPIFGNLITQFFIKNCINKNFRNTLLFSFLLIINYYFLIIISMLIANLVNTDNIGYPIIWLFIIGRLLLGLSFLNQLCKEYINRFVPTLGQIKANQKYSRALYFGYFLTFLLIGVHNCSTGEKYFYITILIISLSSVFLLIISFFTLKYFKNPDINFKILRKTYYEQNHKDQITNNMILEQNEKQIVEEQENMFENANNLAPTSGKNLLKEFSREIEKKNKNYFNKVFLYLILFLITSQYSSENCLIFLHIIVINIYKENSADTTLIIGLFCNSFSYLINLIINEFFLKKLSAKNIN